MRNDLAYLLILLTTTACGGKDSEDSGPGDSGTVGDTCDITASAVYPFDGESDVYFRSSLEMALSDADPSASLTAVDATGATVAGTVNVDPESHIVTFTPSQPLEPGSSYTLTLSWCRGDASVGFTTSDLGTPLAASVEGRTYAVDPASGRFLEPPGAGSLLGGLLGGKVLMGVVSEGSTLDMLGALSGAGVDSQDTCNRTADLPRVEFSESPYFALPQGDVVLSIAGSDIKIGGMTLSGTFSSDGTWFGGGTIAGELDARNLAPLLTAQLGETTPDGVCELLSGFGVACEACAADGQLYCVNILVDQIVADETGESLMPITEADCNETCALSCDNAECPEAAQFAICE